MSLACWMVVYAPQVWENYQLQSGEGLSVAFIVLWLAGDLTGLAGSLMAGLIPSVTILAIYVSFESLDGDNELTSSTHYAMLSSSARSFITDVTENPSIFPNLANPLLRAQRVEQTEPRPRTRTCSAHNLPRRPGRSASLNRCYPLTSSTRCYYSSSSCPAWLGGS